MYYKPGKLSPLYTALWNISLQLSGTLDAYKYTDIAHDPLNSISIWTHFPYNITQKVQLDENHSYWIVYTGKLRFSHFGRRLCVKYRCGWLKYYCNDDPCMFQLNNTCNIGKLDALCGRLQSKSEFERWLL